MEIDTSKLKFKKS